MNTNLHGPETFFDPKVLDFPANILCEIALAQARQKVKELRLLGAWPDWVDDASIYSRIPTDTTDLFGGFDAGIACTLGMIPWNRQRLSATLHANYTKETIDQVRKEIAEGFDPASETVWWLAACSVCNEGQSTQVIFKEQVEEFWILVGNPTLRRDTAIQMYEKMKRSFSVGELGDDIPFGLYDGCIQGAYICGYPFGVEYLESIDQYFIGTYFPSLGIPDEFKWSKEVDTMGRPKSGPVFGSKQFVMCANRQELISVLRFVSQALLPI